MVIVAQVVNDQTILDLAHKHKAEYYSVNASLRRAIATKCGTEEVQFTSATLLLARVVEREVGERSLKIGIHQQKRSEGDFVKNMGRAESQLGTSSIAGHAISGTRQGGVLVGIRLGGSPTLPDNNISPVCVAHFSTFKKKKKIAKCLVI